MHPSSFENMQKCYDCFVRGTELEGKEKVVVLDIGGADVNGSYRGLFGAKNFDYITAGLVAEAGVDVVLEDPYRVPFEDSSVDIVLCGQMLEHCEFFWLAFAEMVRVIRKDGYVFLIAPSAGPIHRFPVDCYRFYPDAFQALAKYTGCELVDSWLDERGPWNDLVGVFRRYGWHERKALCRTAPQTTPPVPLYQGSADEERTSGDRDYYDVLASIHAELEPTLYLEIGVRRGGSLSLARCPAIGGDPAPAIDQLASTAKVVRTTSDAFFEGPQRYGFGGSPDLAFIDGMHLFEFALRDFMNIERISNADTLVIVDDIFPSHPAQANRSRATRVWTGDIWKLHLCLRRYRPNSRSMPRPPGCF